MVTLPKQKRIKVYRKLLNDENIQIYLCAYLNHIAAGRADKAHNWPELNRFKPSGKQVSKLRHSC